MPLEISKVAYLGSSKNKTQEFTLYDISINFNIDDGEIKKEYTSKYDANNIISSTCLFVISNKYDLPNNFNLFNFNVKSFKIVANYVYGNNKLSSIVRLKDNDTLIKYPLILHTNSEHEDEKYKEDEEDKEDKEDEVNDIINNKINKLFSSNISYESKNTIENFSEHDKPSTHDNTPNPPDPYITSYWLIPLSILICVGVYYAMMHRNNKRKHSHYSSSDSE
jgi:hypothetical protein